MNPIALILVLATAAIAGNLALHEQALPEVKATIQLPEGWTSVPESEEGIFVYHLGKGDSLENADPLGMTLSVTTKVPERTTQSPSAYASAIIDSTQDEGPNTPIQKGESNSLPTLRSEYAFECDKGKMRAINIAIANDKTGTLYFFTWQAALDEPAEAEAVREKIFASVKLDPEF